MTKGTFTVDLAKLQAMGGAVTRSYQFKNQYNEEHGEEGSTRVYYGVKLRDFLAKQGVAIDKLGSGATLVATARDGDRVTIYYNDIISDNTLLAWEMNGSSIGSEAPRLCPGWTTGVNSLLFLKGVVSITLS